MNATIVDDACDPLGPEWVLDVLLVLAAVRHASDVDHDLASLLSESGQLLLLTATHCKVSESSAAIFK